MNIEINGKLVWTSARLMFVCMFVAVGLTYMALAYFTNEIIGFDVNIGIGLGISAGVTMIVGFPVLYVVLYQRQQLEITNKQLLNLIRYDQLTGLLSRASFFEDVKNAQMKNSSGNQYNAVFFMDLDHFKKINDRYGHAAGDEVLRRFGSVVSKQMQEGDLVSRLGGEEFAVFIPDCMPDQAESYAENLARMFAREVIEFNGEEIRCTVSIGVYAENKGEDLDAMLSKADELLYKAKQSGRNRVISREISRLAA